MSRRLNVLVMGKMAKQRNRRCTSTEMYKEALGDKAGFIWQYKKNDGIDPAITCDQQ